MDTLNATNVTPTMDTMSTIIQQWPLVKVVDTGNRQQLNPCAKAGPRHGLRRYEHPTPQPRGLQSRMGRAW